MDFKKLFEQMQRERAARGRRYNRGNQWIIFDPRPKEMDDPDYLVHMNEALLRGMSVIDAHAIAQQRVRQRVADGFAAGDEGADVDPEAE